MRSPRKIFEIKMFLESQVACQLLPETRLPAIYFKNLRVERCNRHGSGCFDLFIRCIFRSQLHLLLVAFTGRVQAVNSKTEIREHFIIDDVVEEYGIRIECILCQDDTIIK